MKLSRKFVSDYIELPNIDIKKIADDMTNIGNEYDYASKLINCTNLVIGEVIECVDHPDSDHLHVCKVNVGSEALTIVCGAPNCRKGLKVIVALNGAKIPGMDIKKGMIRGIESNGMLMSKLELGIDQKFLNETDKEGIHELNSDAVVGDDPIKYLGLDDEIIDFELTSNRGDLLSILGMAHELGAIYKTPVKDINLEYRETNNNINDTFKVDIQTDDCPLFLVKLVTNVTIKESPDFIKNRLIASGIRPINNVVDISNYVMLETGQPLHFYDANNLGNKITVRKSLSEETLITLDSNKRILNEEDIVIEGNNEAIGLAGVMGGKSTEVLNTTKNIIIESAIFNGICIRKTAKRILRSEASNRFEKGIDPKRTYMAINRSCHLLEKYADATIEGGMVIYDKTNNKEKVITLKFEKLNKVLGIVIDSETVENIFKSLSFKTELKRGEITVTVPTHRLDINIVEDLIEEVGRIYGIDNIKGKLPTLQSIPGTYNKVNRQIKDKMISLGLNETLSYALIKESEVHKFTKDNFTEIKLADPMSEDRNTLRYSLIHSLKEVFEYNKARNLKNISIFEMGKGFFKTDTYNEETKLACLMTGEYYLGVNKEKVDFYIIKGILEELLNYLGYSNRYSLIATENISNELHPNQSASIIMQGELIGMIGKLNPMITKDDIYVFEINLDKLLKNRSSKMVFKEITKYPSISKDIAFVVKKDVNAETFLTQIKKSGGRLLTSIDIFDVYEGENVLSDEKSLAFSCKFSDPTKTLSDDEVTALINKIIIDVEEKCQAKLRNK